MRIVSWNVQSLLGGPEKIVAAVLIERPSLVVLQEYPSQNGTAAVESTLAANGFFPLRRPVDARLFRTIVFAPQEARLVQSPRQLAVDDPYWVDVELCGVGISAAHIAIPKYAARREMHWQAALSLTNSKRDVPHILIGDLNTTRHGIDQVGASIPGDHQLHELEAGGWVEAWRAMHPDPASPEYSWYHATGVGFRFDQAWLSPVLAPQLVHARMNHDVREHKLSDHSMLLVDLDV